MFVMQIVLIVNFVCVINCVYYDDQGKCYDISLDVISDVIESGNGFVWVGLYEFDDCVLLKLQEEFCLYLLVIEDVCNVYQCLKVEVYGNLLFVVVIIVQMVDECIEYGEIYVFFGLCFLVMVCYGVLLFYVVLCVWVECELELLCWMGFLYCLYVVLDFVVDNYLLIIQCYCDMLELLEKDIFVDCYKCQIVVWLYEFKCDFNKMCMVVVLLQDMFLQIKCYQGELVLDEVKLYLCDVYDYVVCISDVIDILCEMLGIVLSVNLLLVILVQGEMVKCLGVWVVFFVVLILIISWYGMNFIYMFELDKLWVYLVMIIGVGVVCVGLYCLFKCVCWLQCWLLVGFCRCWLCLFLYLWVVVLFCVVR